MSLEKRNSGLPGWLTSRFARTESRENPAEQNIARIREDFSQMVDEAKPIPTNTWFAFDRDIMLYTHSSRPIEATLLYQLQKGTKNDDYFMLGIVEIQKRESTEWLAYRNWYINIFNDDQIGFYLDITSRSETGRGWEGNRLGMSLIRLSDPVIEHLMSHLSQFDRLPVKATMQDQSHGHYFTFKHRHLWTTNQALTLGYTPPEESKSKTFVKWYRR